MQLRSIPEDDEIHPQHPEKEIQANRTRIPIRQRDEILARLRHGERQEGLDPDYVTNAVKDVLLKLRP